MRHLILIAALLICYGCTSTKDTQAPTATAETPGYEQPTDLEGPAYDPSTSPQPMTATTVLPKPPGAAAPAGEQPAAYGTTPAGALAQAAPATYGSTTPGEPMATTATMSPKGDVAAAPVTYSNGVATLPTGQAAALAANLTGLWVNASNEREVVEFTPDHYSTFYDGELLFQEAMSYYAECPADCSGGEPLGISCFTISGPAGTDCYGIVRLTPEILELSMLGVSTETITYLKK